METLFTFFHTCCSIAVSALKRQLTLFQPHVNLEGQSCASRACFNSPDKNLSVNTYHPDQLQNIHHAFGFSYDDHRQAFLLKPD